jgi:amidophosphoribosyltransferase
LIYQDLDDLIDAVRHGKAEVDSFDTSVFDGEYVTGDVTQDYLKFIEEQRNDGVRSKQQENESAVIELHNTA